MSRKQESGNPEQSRRRLLKSAAAGGSVLGLTSLPGKWAKPTVASVILPAHAQTSGCVGTLANCPSGDLFSTTSTGPSQYSVTLTNLPPGVSLTNGTLDGSFGTYSSSFIGPCPSPCDTVDGQKYVTSSIAFSNNSVHAGFTLGVRCGGEVVERIAEDLNASYFTNVGGTFTFTGSQTVAVNACKYLTGGGGTLMTIVPLGRRKLF